MRRVLFVCARNKKRSLTAEVHFSKDDRFEVASAGLNKDSDTTVSPDLVLWADTILVMESSHREKLSRRFKPYLKNQRVICLDIPDDYEFMDPALVSLLEEKVEKHLRGGR